jgi:hypothetical protein
VSALGPSKAQNPVKICGTMVANFMAACGPQWVCCTATIQTIGCWAIGAAESTPLPPIPYQSPGSPWGDPLRRPGCRERSRHRVLTRKQRPASPPLRASIPCRKQWGVRLRRTRYRYLSLAIQAITVLAPSTPRAVCSASLAPIKEPSNTSSDCRCAP